MTTPTDFLLARIAEDEAVARDAGDGGPVTHGRRSELTRAWDRDYGPIEGAIEVDSARVLADCEARRRIMEECLRNWDAGGGYDEEAEMARHIARLLALPYADHPDYREEWRP